MANREGADWQFVLRADALPEHDPDRQVVNDVVRQAACERSDALHPLQVLLLLPRRDCTARCMGGILFVLGSTLLAYSTGHLLVLLAAPQGLFGGATARRV